MSSQEAPSARDVADRLHSAAIHLLRRVRRVDEENGLSAARLSALSVLVFGGPLPLGRLAEAEQVSAPTMSRLVSGLEREGLVVREPHPDDGRVVVVHATPEGVQVLERGRARRIAELEQLVSMRSSDQIATLGDAAAIIEAMTSAPPSAESAYAAATAERRWSGSE